MKLYIAQLNPILGDFTYNTNHILEAIQKAKNEKADLVVFPEMAICGYNPEDLFLEPGFVDQQEAALERIVAASKGISVIVGTVRENIRLPGKPLCNSACIIEDGAIVGFQDKCLLPTYDVFDEWRYFEPAKGERVWGIAGKKIGITICEDIWPAFDSFLENRYKDDPLECFIQNKIDLVINISASPYSITKIKSRHFVAQKVAKRLHAPLVLVNQVGGQDGLLFDGSSFVVAPNGELLAQAKSFSEDSVIYDMDHTKGVKQPHVEQGEELYKALAMGVRDYFHKQSFTKACFGLSGGIDSAIVAQIAVEALGRENVLALYMPSRFSSQESREDAQKVASNLGIKLREISIEPALHAILKSLEDTCESKDFGVTEENLQSRIRANLLMAVSNKNGYMVLNTGNKSEVAMGYTTLYGDAIGAISVLGDLLKREVYEVARYINKVYGTIPERCITKAPSAELRFNQKDSDTLPEYPILDTIVDEFIVHHKRAEEISKTHGIDAELVTSVIKKIHANEYKRRQLPFALRVSEKAFSLGRRVPIVSRISFASTETK